MELIERYLQAVGFWLPKAQKQDILAELSEDIRSQVEDKESELARKLTDAEVENILKRRGSPITVANRYLPQRNLIGPVLYPIYRLVLKMAFLFYAIPWLVVWLCISSYLPSYHAKTVGDFIAGTLHGLWLAILYTFASVTFAFGLLEKYALKSGFLEKWNPAKLPPLRAANRIKHANSIGEIVAFAVALIWWINFMLSPVMLNRPDIRIVLAPGWRYYSWWIVVLIAVTMATSVLNLLRPYWTHFRAGVRLVTDVVGWGMFAWLCKANIVAEIAVRNVPPEKTLQVANAINFWMGRSFPFIVAIGIVIATIDIYRIFHVKTGTRPPLCGLASICGMSTNF